MILTLIKQRPFFLSGQRFGFNLTEEKVAPHFYVSQPRVEENSTKNRRIATAGHIPANSEGTQSSGIPKTSDR
jgi:hypothetical protein